LYILYNAILMLFLTKIC